MLTLQRATAALLAPTNWVARCSRLLGEVRERYREWPTQDTREARGITLLSEWLTIDQRAQFEAEKCFEVIVAIPESITAFSTVRRSTSTNSMTIADR